MKHLFLPAILFTFMSASIATPAWARAVPRPDATMSHAAIAHAAVVPAYRVYGPAFGWGGAYPFWWGPVVPYVIPYGVVTGGLRLEVTPKTAQVFVDGAYAGVVDDFNGHFQHLDLAPGGHRIEISAQGFEPLTFNTYVQPDHTIDYKATMVAVAD
ncbi:MAG TPA: hypothetical protein VH583_14605 [Vicinamibacterales bacterium]|jgi:hypothetical protein